MVENSYQNSTIAQILEAIINEGTFEGESHSNIADILLSILNHTEYTEEPKSVIADLLLRVKKKIEGEAFEPYDGPYVSRIAEILLSILNETEYTEEPQSRIAELLLQLKEELEAYTELTASGVIASFTTNVVKPLVNGEFTIQAYQEGSGNPSPVNVRNIVPFNALNIYKSAENLFDPSYIIENGFIDITGTFQQAGGAFGAWNATDFIEVSGDTTYLFNPNSTGGNSAKHAFYNATKGFISTINSGKQLFTTPSNARYMRFSFRATSEDIQLLEPEIKTVDLGEDIYGGGYNSVTGKKTKTYILIEDLSNEDWTYNPGNNTFSTASIKGYTDGEAFTCNKYLAVGYESLQYMTNNKAQLRTIGLFIKDTSYNGDVNAFKASLTDIQIKKLIETPIETQLEPTPINTFNGANNIFCDTGDTSVTYLYKGTPPESVQRLLSKGPSIDSEEVEIKKIEDEELEKDENILEPDVIEKEAHNDKESN